MRTFTVLPILLLAAVLAWVGCAGGRKPPAVDAAAITAVIDSLGRATNAAIAAKDTMLSAPGTQLVLTSGQKIVSQAGDMVVDLGTYDYQGLDPKQKPVQDVGKYVSVYKQVDGQWKMVVDAWNSDPAPAKPGK